MRTCVYLFVAYVRVNNCTDLEETNRVNWHPGDGHRILFWNNHYRNYKNISYQLLLDIIVSVSGTSHIFCGC
uniref:Uncharacterized protein n=1 Tax=Pararge aegeria TaxID=116150 RepID=S4NT55_9NEOP